MKAITKKIAAIALVLGVAGPLAYVAMADDEGDDWRKWDDGRAVERRMNGDWDGDGDWDRDDDRFRRTDNRFEEMNRAFDDEREESDRD